jgi:phosphoribosylglycinamide formyltransferase 2
MNRKLIRDLAAKELNLKTAKYEYATNLNEYENAVNKIGIPCVVKPLMSSSGKGQSILKKAEDITTSWQYAIEGSRGDLKEIIVEEFIDFHTEITLLTVTQQNGETLFCPPIGHRQERGDYQESWQPCPISENDLKDAQHMAAKVTAALSGAGVWGVEFFLTKNGVYFSELSPRPHDTGMVTLAGTQNFNEFELHARAILGLPIHQIDLIKCGISAVILSNQNSTSLPQFTGIKEALSIPNIDVRIFGKPSSRINRRMGVTLINGPLSSNMEELKEKCKKAASMIRVN